MRRYGQRCPVARALDVIGQRWVPLIVRELLLGPKRYTDLLDGLPGIGTNILAGRLSDLESCGVIGKHTLPRPTPVVVYELTDAGRALAPVLRELRAWGDRFAPASDPDDVARPAWVIQSAIARAPGLDAGRVCQLQVGTESFELTGAGDAVDVRAGSVSQPDAALTIEPALFMGLASGRIAPAAASKQIEIEGDRRVARDVLTMLAGSVR
jgi:DNA-binding HxlR family transcriptional regulator